MKKHGIEFYLEYLNIHEDDNWNTDDFLDKIKPSLNNFSSVVIDDIGFYQTTNTLVFHGFILEETKKEVNAIYTCFKSQLTKTLQSLGYNRPKPCDRIKLYFIKT